jgi:hypothetical protein
MNNGNETQERQTEQTEQATERPTVPSLVNLAIVVDFLGVELPTDNGGDWHRVVLQPDMAQALYMQLAPFFPQRAD